MKTPLILVDGSSYFFRAFHALPPLTNSKGKPTGAIYGVANMIKKLVKEYQPEHFAVVFDAKGKTFRDELYPEYKAHRPPMPEELSSQFLPLLEVLRAQGYPLLIIDGVEADDVIGTLAKHASDRGQEVIISTGDKDMAQLVNEKVTLINTMSNTVMDRQGVYDKFQVWPEQIIDYLSLVGDSVDNVPGVPKCGPKTAAKWLNEYLTLDELLKHQEAITGKIGDNLRASASLLTLSKQLVTIKTDVSLPIDIDELTIQPADKELLLNLIKDLEFKTWIKELLSQSQEEQAETPSVQQDCAVPFTIINTWEQFDQLLGALTACQSFCVDTETTSLDAISAQIVGIALAIEENHAVYIPLLHKDGTQQLPKQEVLASLKPILENPRIAKIGQNLKYDYNVFLNEGIQVQGIDYDTMLESYILNSGASRHDMDSLALKYLGYKTITFEEVAGKGSKQVRFDEVPVDKAAPYSAEDADITLKLHHTLYPLMDEQLRKVFHEIEMPLVTVLAEMERVGVLIDKQTLENQGVRLKARLIELEKEAVILAGKPFNLNSPKQLQEILFEDLKLPVISKTPTGQASTAEAVLQELGYEFRLPAVILEYRSLSKLVSTYIDALPKKISSTSGRVHTSYNQAVAATGRLSSSDPNLQNIPIRTEEGRAIRKAFIAPPGHLIMAADYSQIELRIMAHLSQDYNLLQAFANGWDIHTATASEIFQVDMDKVTSEHRRRAKAVNFGLIYGMSAFGLAKQIGVDRKDAQYYIDCYFKRYPGVLQYMEKTREQAHKLGYVETMFGRRLYLPEINVRNMAMQKAAERTAINAPMQGTAADLIKKAMLAVAQWQQHQPKPSARMIMQVHDELVFEVMEEHVGHCEDTIRNLMENAVKLSVPLLVSVGIGKNWDEAH